MSVLTPERRAACFLLAGAIVVMTGCVRNREQNPAAQTGPASSQQKPAKPIEPTKADSATANAPAQPPLFSDWPKPLVAVVLTGQQLGYIEPCGCTGLENQKGGLARRQTFIKQLKEDRGWTVLPLDVGGQVKGFGKEQEVKFGHVVQGLRAMGYRGIAFGEGDLRLTPGELLAAIAGPDGTVTDFVSGNVAVLARELQPRFLVIEAAGKRIGVTAVLGEKFESKLRGDELIHQSPLDALKDVLPELKAKGCDFYILLAHAPLDEARKLAQATEIFDLVVASGETSLPSGELERVAGTKTSLVQVGQKAMHVGVVGIFESPAPLRYESVPLDARFQDSPDMLKLLADYQDRLREMGLQELGIKPQPHPTGRKFVGSEKCGECHTKSFAKWKETGHSHATDSLVMPPNSRGDIARHFDPECLSCHVTGWAPTATEPPQHFPYDSGYLSLDKTPQLKHSGCENCHGPGSAHVAAENGEGNLSENEIVKLREAMRKPLAGGDAERKCLECHDVDNSPDFHKPAAFERYWKKIEHKGKD